MNSYHGALREYSHRGQALRFGWQPRKPQSTRLKLQYLHGTTVLTGEGGDKLACIRL